MSSLDHRITELRACLGELGQAVVCFSGGVDSGYLLAETVAVLGSDALGLTAVSPSLAPEERDSATRVAQRLGARHLLIDTDELDDARYRANPVNRCYFCKVEVYGQAVTAARRLGIPHVLDGFNRDDRGDHRPGRQAAREQGVRSPLDELGFTKADTREAAHRLELPIWDKPALACLSSRFPYGTEITPDRLRQVADSERALRDLGFKVCRVRYHGEAARLEVDSSEIARLSGPKVLAVVTRRLRDAGFTTIEIDPLGYRSGALNETIPAAALKATGAAS